MLILLLLLLQSSLSKELSSLTSANSLPLWADAGNVNIKKKQNPKKQAGSHHRTKCCTRRRQRCFSIKARAVIPEKGIPDDSSLWTNDAAAEREERRGRTHFSGTHSQTSQCWTVLRLEDVFVQPVVTSPTHPHLKEPPRFVTCQGCISAASSLQKHWAETRHCCTLILMSQQSRRHAFISLD